MIDGVICFTDWEAPRGKFMIYDIWLYKCYLLDFNNKPVTVTCGHGGHSAKDRQVCLKQH